MPRRLTTAVAADLVGKAYVNEAGRADNEGTTASGTSPTWRPVARTSALGLIADLRYLAPKD